MKPQTSDKAFLDSNLVVYLYSSTEPLKRSAVMEIFEQVDCPLVSNYVHTEDMQGIPILNGMQIKNPLPEQNA